LVYNDRSEENGTTFAINQKEEFYEVWFHFNIYNIFKSSKVRLKTSISEFRCTIYILCFELCLNNYMNGCCWLHLSHCVVSLMDTWYNFACRVCSRKMCENNCWNVRSKITINHFACSYCRYPMQYVSSSWKTKCLERCFP
jgi:hypothetical protein